MPTAEHADRGQTQAGAAPYRREGGPGDGGAIGGGRIQSTPEV